MDLQDTELQQEKIDRLEQDELHEKEADAKRSYQEKIGTDLKEWATKFDHLKAEVEKSRAELRKMFERRIEILKNKQRVAVKKLSILKRSTEEGWEEFKSGLEKSLDDLGRSLEQTLSTFRERQEDIAEKVSKGRKAYIEKIEAQFSDWSAKIDTLKTKMRRIRPKP